MPFSAYLETTSTSITKLKQMAFNGESHVAIALETTSTSITKLKPDKRGTHPYFGLSLETTSTSITRLKLRQYDPRSGGSLLETTSPSIPSTASGCVKFLAFTRPFLLWEGVFAWVFPN